MFCAEGELALAFSDTMLRGLGASSEQIERERERVHLELFGRSGLKSDAFTKLDPIALPPEERENTLDKA